MRALKVAGGVVLTMMGIVWTLQGFGASYVPTSFMTNALEWILIGLITAAAGVTVVARSARKP